VSRVDSFVDLDPSLALEQYQMLAAMPSEARPPAIQDAVAQTMGNQMALLVVRTSYAAGSDPARDLVRRIRERHPRGEGRLLVTGHTAFDVDFSQLVRDNAPRAVALIVVATYVRAVPALGIDPAARQGRAHETFCRSARRTEPSCGSSRTATCPAGSISRRAPIETGTPLIMFCVVFGLSMDYGVLLLSRVLEEYQRTGDNVRAVGLGLERIGRVITAAAAIMAAVFFAFALADLVVIKAIGIGMGIAVVLDATIVRALVVPATMRLLGRWNWWAPAPLVRWHARVAGRLVKTLSRPLPGREPTPRGERCW